VWSELDKKPGSQATARKPHVSSLRRNLQREHLDRIVDLAMGGGGGESAKPISNLAISKLRALNGKLSSVIGEKGDQTGNLDPYTFAHLSEAKIRIQKVLDAQYIVNGGGGMGGLGGMLFGQPAQQQAPQSGESLLLREHIREASSSFEPPAAPAAEPEKK
jgi:hypothetical protein